jgi:tetratricopeptide (TPR) repeat protein
MNRSKLQTWTLVSALALASSPAAAQPTNKPAAEVLFQRGRELMREQRFSEACAKLEASQEIDAGIGTLLYLGDCYEQLGRTASAWAAFKEAASLAQARSDERERVASIRASALESRLTRLTLRVPPNHRIDGLTIRVGGAPIPEASWGVGLPVDPGSQRVEVTAPDHDPWSRNIRLAGGGLVVLDVPRLRQHPPPKRAAAAGALAPTRASVPAADLQSDAAPGSGQRTVALVIGGIGVAALAAGTVLAVQAQHKKDSSLDYCPNDPNVCSSRGKELRDTALDYAHASTAVFAAGGALVVASLVVHVTSPSPRRTAGRGVAVNAAFDGASGQLRLSGGF